MNARDVLPLFPALPSGAALIALDALPCRVCGVASGAPELVTMQGRDITAYCTLDHASQHGWPWIVSETAPGGTPDRTKAHG